MRGQASIDAGLGALRAVAAGAVGPLASLEGLACSVDRGLSELRFLGDDQGSLIVALGATQISRGYRARWTLRAIRTCRSSRPGGARGAGGGRARGPGGTPPPKEVASVTAICDKTHSRAPNSHRLNHPAHRQRSSPG